MTTLKTLGALTAGLLVATAVTGNVNADILDVEDITANPSATHIQLAQTSATPLQPGFRPNQPKPPKPGGLAPTPKPFKPGLTPKPTPFKPGFKAPTGPTQPPHTGPGSFQGTANISCTFGFSKTKAQKGVKGYVVNLECLSAVIKCPSLDQNVGAQGKPTGLGSSVTKVNVPAGNEHNHFRIKYNCTYYHTEG